MIYIHLYKYTGRFTTIKYAYPITAKYNIYIYYMGNKEHVLYTA